MINFDLIRSEVAQRTLLLVLVLVVFCVFFQARALAQEDTLEEVFVTGSNIRRDATDSPTALTSLGDLDLSISADSLIATTLFNLPSTGVPGVSQSNSNFKVFASGLSTVDLRNLGTARTLVLVNGRRYVGGDSENPNVVDLNSIPAGFIQSIEIVTGGASAVYGSEAMAGVVNIITKDNLEGFEADMQVGQSAEGDGEEFSLSLTGGINFAEDKGNMMFYLGFSEVNEIYSRDRDFSKSDEFLGDFEAYSGFPPQGGIFTNNGYTTIAADGTWTKEFVSAEDGFNRADHRLLQIPLTRKDIATEISYAFSEKLEMFVETSYTQTESFSNLEPTITGQFISVGDNPLLLPSDNPFIPAEVLATWTDAGEDIPSGLTFRKRFSELGPRYSEQNRETIRMAIGLEGEVFGLGWDAYYQWGQTTRGQTSTGNFNSFYFQQALDVEADPDNSGGYRCKDQLARSLGCVPINVFGVGSISPEAIDFVAVGAQDKSQIEQNVIAAKTYGDLFNIVSTPVSFAAGIEYRDEELVTVVDALSASGLSSSNTSAPVNGDYDVTEVFAEVDLPLLENLPGAQYVSANLAYRHADYSTLGGLSSWKVGLQWEVIDGLRLRSAVSESVRAPNLAELYDPGGETFEDYIDPCLNGGVNGAGSTATNCASLGIPSDYDPGSSGGSVGGIQAGNPNLDAETADTQTIGFVYTPSLSFDFSITLDYFDIKIEDAIELIDPQVKIDQCYAAADFPNNEFCDGIVRAGENLDFLLTRLDFGLENIGVLKTSGYDLEVNFGFDVLGGDLGIKTLVTRTNDWSRDVNNVLVSDYEEPGYQKWKGFNRLTYGYGSWLASWSMRYIGSGVVDNAFTTEEWPDNENLKAVTYHDVQFRFDQGGDEGFAVFAGIKNLTDKQPPYIPSPSENSDTGTATAAGVYDVIGRFFYTGVEYRL